MSGDEHTRARIHERHHIEERVSLDLLGEERARSVRDRVVDDVAKTETPVDDFEQGVFIERRAGACERSMRLSSCSPASPRAGRAQR
jgi:hypothetical protein